MSLRNLRILNLSVSALCVFFNLNLISMQQEQKFKNSKKIKQYRVLNNGDRSFSGYHALYNSFLLFKSRENKALKSLLTSNENRDRFFGSIEAEWQKNVIESRIKTLAEFYLEDNLIKNLRNADISQDSTANDYKFHLSNDYARINIAPDNLNYEKIRLFLNKIPVIVRNIIDEQYQSNDQQDKVNFDITAEIIKSAFLSEYEETGLEVTAREVELIFLELFQDEGFNLEFEVISDSQIKDARKQELYNINWTAQSGEEFVKRFNLKTKATVEKPGHWLNAQDLDNLIKLEKDRAIEIPEDMPVFCLDKDIRELFNLDQLKNLAREFRDINYSGSAIFLIYIKEKRHWISCFVVKDSDETPKFLFTDSLNNDRLKTDLILTLISLLSEHVLDISNIELPPLELLLNGKTTHIKALIETLKNEKDRKSISKGMFLHGAPGTGKFSLAYTMAKLAQWKFLYVEAACVIGDLTIFNTDEGATLITKEELKNKGEEIFGLFTKNIQGQLPMVVFIHGIDQILKDTDSSGSRKAMFDFMLDILLVLKSKYKHLIYIICTSYLTPKELPSGNKVLELTNAFELDLPDYDKRNKIICYYIDNLISDVLREGYRLRMLKQYNCGKVLTTASNGFSCSDIKEFMTLTRNAIISGDKNTENCGMWFGFYNYIDFRNRPLMSSLAIFPSAWIVEPITEIFLRDDYEKLLFTFCKLQAEQVKKRKDLKSTSSSSINSSDVINGALKIAYFALLSREGMGVFVITELGKAFVAGMAESIKEGTAEFTKKNVNKYILHKEENVSEEKKS